MINETEENTTRLREWHGKENVSAQKKAKKYIAKYPACREIADRNAIVKTSIDAEIGNGDFWLKTRATDYDIALFVSFSIPRIGPHHYDSDLFVLPNGLTVAALATARYMTDGYSTDGKRTLWPLPKLRDAMLAAAEKTIKEVNELGKKLDKEAEARMLEISHLNDRRITKLNRNFCPVPEYEDGKSPLDYTTENVKEAHAKARETYYGNSPDAPTRLHDRETTWGEACKANAFFGDPLEETGCWVMNSEIGRKLSSIKKEYKRRLEYIIPDLEAEEENREDRKEMYKAILTWEAKTEKEATRDVVTDKFLTKLDRELLHTAQHRRDPERREDETFEFWADWRKGYWAYVCSCDDDYDPDSYDPHDDDWITATHDDEYEEMPEEALQLSVHYDSDDEAAADWCSTDGKKEDDWSWLAGNEYD